jgi:hypothetical protein
VRTQRPRHSAAAAALGVLLTAACGTTVPLAEQAGSGDQLGNGGSGPTASGGPLTVGPTGTGHSGSDLPAAGAPGTATGSTATAGPAASQGPAAPVAGGAVPDKGPGWDKTTLAVGVVTVNDLHTVAAGLGINVDPGDLGADANAVASYINEHGGVLGRKVKVFLHDTSTVAVASNPESVASEVCTDFVQDHRVAMLYNPVTTLDTANFRACFAKAGIPIFSASSAMLDTTATKGLAGLFYQTAMVTWDKLAPVLVSRLKAQGWFGGWNARLGAPSNDKPKLGIVASTTPAGTRIAADLKRNLAAAGYPGAVVYQWSDASQGQSASVNFMAGNGVTHIIVTDLELTAFQNSAQSQQYKPRYGISSYNDPYTNLETLSPQGANNGAMGIGWAPAYDVSDANDPGATGEGQKRCLALMAKANQTFSGRRTAKLFALATCDSLLLGVQGAASGRGFDAPSIYAGALRISPTFSTAVSFGNSALTPTHLFTPSSARDLQWFTDCKCFKYVSKTATGHF